MQLHRVQSPWADMLLAGANSSSGKNHPSAGRVVNGVFVERELKYDLGQVRSVTLNLLQPDFTTRPIYLML